MVSELLPAALAAPVLMVAVPVELLVAPPRLTPTPSRPPLTSWVTVVLFWVALPMAVLPPELALAAPALVTPAPCCWPARKLFTWLPEVFDWPTVVPELLPAALAAPVVMLALPCELFVWESSRPTSTGINPPPPPVTLVLLVDALPMAVLPPVLALADPELVTVVPWLLPSRGELITIWPKAMGAATRPMPLLAKHGHGRNGDAPRYRVVGTLRPCHDALPAQAATTAKYRRDITPSGRRPR